MMTFLFAETSFGTAHARALRDEETIALGDASPPLHPPVRTIRFRRNVEREVPYEEWARELREARRKAEELGHILTWREYPQYTRTERVWDTRLVQAHPVPELIDCEERAEARAYDRECKRTWFDQEEDDQRRGSARNHGRKPRRKHRDRRPEQRDLLQTMWWQELEAYNDATKTLRSHLGRTIVVIACDNSGSMWSLPHYERSAA